MTADELNAPQLHALFDILTHYETYREIEDFKHPETVTNYGFPFVRADGKPAAASASPLLQKLVTTFVLTIPGITSLPPSFWNVNVQGILTKFSEANLSESFDKGAMGTRKTLTTVSSSAIEVAVRGVLGGCPRRVRINGCLRQSEYEPGSALHLVKAWEDVVQELVYGPLIDELFDFVQTTENLEEHSPAVEAAVEYIIVHLATVLHQIFVISPEGQYIVKLIENLHRLLPYGMIRQTLRVGNAATMINGIVKLLLAKLSIGSVSNWIGMTENADDGMNLLQRIVSMILSWDSSDFRKSADKIKKAKSGPSKEHLAATEEHIASPREEQERVRWVSIETRQSVVVTFLSARDPALATSLTEEAHVSCLEYYSARLSVRDRDEITKVLCRQQPDLPTQALRDLVAAFDPIIREIHSKVPIHEHMADAEAFITEFIETSRGKRQAATAAAATAGDMTEPGPPSVKDFVEMLRRNRSRLYKWLHRLAKECPDLRETFRTWAKESIRAFRREMVTTASASATASATATSSKAEQAAASGGGSDWAGELTKALEESGTKVKGGKETVQGKGGAGAMGPAISAMFASLPAETRRELIPVLDRHAAYLSALAHRSTEQMQAILDELSISTKDTAGSGSASGTGTGTSTPGGGSIGSKSSNSGGSSSSRVGRGSTPGSQGGPGVYLVRWQDLMDETLVTSATPEGPPRSGREVKGEITLGKAAVGGKVKEKEVNGLVETLESARVGENQQQKQRLEAPDVRPVVDAMGLMFRELLVRPGVGPGVGPEM